MFMYKILFSWFVAILICLIGLFNYIYLYNISSNKRIQKSERNNEQSWKYILLWSSWSSYEHIRLKLAQESFLENKCAYNKCFVSDGKNVAIPVDKYDAIVFTSLDISTNQHYHIPVQRSPFQKYVFMSTLPALKYLIFNKKFDGFFNWTWTFRLESDVLLRHVRIYNKTHLIGPNIMMVWPDLKPITEELKKKLDSKFKVAAWYTSQCNGNRRRFAQTVSKELENRGFFLDIYGDCTEDKNSTKEEFFEMLRRDYYFYFSFESTCDDDYVTDELLVALNNFAVPVVFGGAEYSRFLPYGSYIEAKALGEVRLADTMISILQNKTRYHDYFRWRNHYIYKAGLDDELCNICTALHNENMSVRSSYNDFRFWWNRQSWTKAYDEVAGMLPPNFGRRFGEKLKGYLKKM